jgi:SAM-dependent methyltransferase
MWVKSIYGPCPLCTNHASFSVAYRPYLISKIVISRCDDCGLRFLRPMPTQGYYEYYYGTHYFRGVVRKKENSMDSRSKKVFEQMSDRANKIFSFVSPSLRRHQEVVALEVGPSDGSNLYALNRLKAKMTLYEDELDRRWEPELREKDIKHWMDAPKDQLFDCIILSHVLEHFTDPLLQLKKFAKLLRKNGVIYIEVPNVPEDKGPGLPYKLCHTIYFSEKTLKLMAGVSGLELVKMDTSDVIASLWCMIDR